MERGEGLRVVHDQHPVGALTRFWVCPRCTLHNQLSAYDCAACAYRRPRPPPARGLARPPSGEAVASVLLR